jgi:hypothetical protein
MPNVFSPDSHTAAPKTPPKSTPNSALNTRAVDYIFIIVMLTLGFLFWEWLTPKTLELTGYYEGYKAAPALGAFLFIISSVVAAVIWMFARGIRQNAKSLAVLAIIIAGALPFLLYDSLPIYIFLFFFELLACLIWVCFSCGTEVTQKFGGYFFFDIINQLFVIPFVNFGAIFGVGKSAFKNRKGGNGLLVAIIGTVVALPIIAGVIALLISADESFRLMTDKVFALFKPDDYFRRYAWEVFLSVPVAMYIFGQVYGNATRRRTDIIKDESARNFVGKAHRIPSAAVYAPIIILCALYLIFFAAMASYLTSAFGGELPGGFSYAEYARRGFFELCAVAAINLFVLAFAWLLSKRKAGDHPKPLRVMGGILAGLTLLLIATALSKMVLYIDAYGLSRLRLYTTWFMIVLACIFLITLLRHLRPFNAGKPMIIVCALLALALFLSNSDGVIAKYNVEKYESLKLETVDVEMLEYLSDAATPYIIELSKNAPDNQIRERAKIALENRGVHYVSKQLYGKMPYTAWNLQSARAAKLLGVS